MDLRDGLLDVRRNSYARLRGGYPIILAGMIYWLALSVFSQLVEPTAQLQAGFILSNMIVPLAMVIALIVRNPFMKDRTVLSPLLVPTFIAMLLFWPMLFIAKSEAGAGVVISILAIGLSLHWPVIGWTYGRTVLFSAHAIVRAALVLWIFYAFPDQQMLYIPLGVAACYAVTALIVYLDAGRAARRRGRASASAGNPVAT